MNRQKYNITEIFESIQGEGFYTGIPAIFIRFFGCDLSCQWCDSPDSKKGTKNLKPFKTYTIEALCDQLETRYRTAILTGGEPLIQAGIVELVCRLSSAYNIHIETNGTQTGVLKRLREDGHVRWITISPKFEQLPTDEAFFCADEIKWIVTQDDVSRILSKTLELYDKGLLHGNQVFVQPQWFDPKSIEICLGLIHIQPTIFRLSYQIHKILNIR